MDQTNRPDVKQVSHAFHVILLFIHIIIFIHVHFIIKYKYNSSDTRDTIEIYILIFCSAFILVSNFLMNFEETFNFLYEFILICYFLIRLVLSE